MPRDDQIQPIESTASSAATPASASDIVYICDWLPPDFGAVGQYSQMFARELAAEGRRVTLIGLSSSAGEDREDIVGSGRLRTIKLATEVYDKAKTGTRVWWTANTNSRLVRAAWPHILKTREVIFTGSPPLFLHWIAAANLVARRKLVYRITDFHPECAIAERGQPSVLQRAVLALTLFWRRRVDRFEALGHDQIARLAEIGISGDKVTLKPDPSPVRIAAGTPPLDRPPGAEGRTLLLYSGNWGVAHDHDTFTRAYIRHHREGTGQIILWLNAVGRGAHTVAQALEAAGMPFVRGSPVPIEHLANLLVTPDAHLITLSDAFVGYVLPSKVHGCIESDRPVLYIGSPASDVHRLCAERCTHGYIRVDVGNIDECARALERIAEAAQRRAAPRAAE